MTKIHCIVCYDPAKEKYYRFNEQHSDENTGTVGEGIRLLQEADEIIGHNIIGFDIPALQKAHLEFSPRGKVTDTLVISRLIWTDLLDRDLRNKRRSALPQKYFGRHSLKSWGFRLGELKDDFGETTDWKNWSQEMEDYCEQDVRVTNLLWELIQKQRYSEKAIELEHGFASVIFKQEQQGFSFDKQAALDLYTSLSKRRLEIEDELGQVFPPRIQQMKKPAYYEATIQMCNFQEATKGALTKVLRGKGYRPKDYTITPGPPATKQIPFNPGSTDQIADRLIEKYAWKPKEFTDSGKPQVTETILSSLPYPEAAVLKEYLMVNKRIGQAAEGNQAWLKLETNGRIHGRVNTNGAVTGRCTHSNPNVAQVPAVYSPFGKECRSCWKARDGFKLVGWDASGLELRCLAHYMGRFDNGAYARELLEGDIHTLNQEAAGLPTRDNAKTFIYAFLYGAGDAKIGSIVGGGQKEGARLKKKFFSKVPALKRLQDAVKAAVQKNGHLKGLDGRKLNIRSQHAALNTLLQSAGAVVMKEAAVIQYHALVERGFVWNEDFAFVANIHDELQIEARPEIADEVGQAGVDAIRGAGEVYNFRCPLDGEYKIGNNWAETH